MSEATKDSDRAFEALEEAANRATRALEEVKSKQEKRITQISEKDINLTAERRNVVYLITNWCLFLLCVLVLASLLAAVADAVFDQGILDRTLKVTGLIMPVITLILGYYFGSSGK